MTNLDRLIAAFCTDRVEYLKLREVAEIEGKKPTGVDFFGGGGENE